MVVLYLSTSERSTRNPKGPKAVFWELCNEIVGFSSREVAHAMRHSPAQQGSAVCDKERAARFELGGARGTLSLVGRGGVVAVARKVTV